MKTSRRDILKKMGLGALSLPFLEGLCPRHAFAQSGTPKRLLVVVHRHGTIPQKWMPAGNQDGQLMLSDVLVPLANYRDRIVQIA